MRRSSGRVSASASGSQSSTPQRRLALRSPLSQAPLACHPPTQAGPIGPSRYKRRAKLLAQKYRCEINGKVGRCRFWRAARARPKSPHLESECCEFIVQCEKNGQSPIFRAPRGGDLLRRNLRGLDQGDVARCLNGRIWRTRAGHRHRLDAERSEPRLHLRRLQRFGDFLVSFSTISRGVFAGRNRPL